MKMVIMKKRNLHPLCFAIVLALGGCASSEGFNVDSNINELNAALTQPNSADSSFENNEQAPKMYLNDLVEIPELNKVINDALSNNPNLRQYILSLQISELQVKSLFGGALPSASLGMTSTESKNTSSLTTTDLSVSWEVDVWGKVRDGIKVAEYTQAASELELQYVKDVLVANIMRNYLEVSLYQQYIVIEENKIEALEKNKEFILSRYRKGLGELKDIDTAETSISQSKSNLESYKQSLIQSKRSLGLLIGTTLPVDEHLVVNEFPSVISPLDDSSLVNLSNRPDLKKAYADIKQQELMESIAYKDMLPSFSLSAGLSDSASNPLDSLLISPVWSLLGNLTMPLFEGGKLRTDLNIQQLTTEKQFYAYKEKLLTAHTEVQNALDNEVSLSAQEEHLAFALLLAQRNEDNYMNKYQKGLVGMLDLLSVQTSKYDVEANLVNVKFNKLKNRIDLGLAMGLGINSESK